MSDQPPPEQLDTGQPPTEQPPTEQPPTEQPPTETRKIKRHRRRKRGGAKKAQQQGDDARPEGEASSSTAATAEQGPPLPTFVPVTSPPPFVPPGIGLFLPQLQQHESASFSHTPNIFSTGSATLPDTDFKSKYDQEIFRRTIAEVQRDEENRVRRMAEDAYAKLMDTVEIRVKEFENKEALFQQELAHKDDEVRSYEQKLEEASKMVEEERGLTAAADQRYIEQARKNEEISSQLEELRRQIVEKDEAIEGYGQQLEDFQRSSNEDMVEQAHEFDALKKQIEDLQAESAAKNEAIKGHAQQLETHRDTLEREEGKRLKAESQYSNLVRDTENLEKDLEKLQTEISELKDQITKKDADIKAHKHELEVSNKSMKEANDEVDTVLTEKEELQADNDRLKRDVQSMHSEVEERNRRIAGLFEQLKEAREQSLAQEKESIEAQEKLEDIEQRYENFGEDYANMEAELGKFVARSQELDDAIKEAAGHIALVAERDDEIRKLRKLVNYCKQTHDDKMPNPDEMPEVVGPVVMDDLPASPSKRSDLGEELRNKDVSEDSVEAEQLSHGPIHVILDQSDYVLPLTRTAIKTIFDQPDYAPPLTHAAVHEILDQPDYTPPLTQSTIHTINEESSREAAPQPPLSSSSMHTIIEMEPAAPAAQTSKPPSTSAPAPLLTIVDQPPRRPSPSRAATQPQDTKMLAWASVAIVVLLALVQTALTWRERQRWLGANEDTQGLLWATLAGSGEGRFAASMSTFVGSMLGLSELDMAEARSLLY